MSTDSYLELDFQDESSRFNMDRRDFIKIAGSGIILLFSIGDLSLLAQEVRTRGPRHSLPTDFNAFLRIGEDGRIACYTGKIEMGQGVITSLAQELADELDAPLDSVDMVMGDTELCPWDAGTFGSLTTRAFGPALRAAGAEARQVLLELASEKLKAPTDKLVTENGFVCITGKRAQRISYAELTKGKRIERHATGKAAVKKPAEFKIMTKPLTHRDAAEKVSGKAKYAGDIQLPDMLYARILRPPSHDAKLIDVDLSEARQMKDVQVIKEGDFIAVLHRHPDVAEAALSKIKARFDKPQSDLNDTNIFDYLLKNAPEGRTVAQDGDLQKGESESKIIVEETYLDGYKAHAPMEPHTAVVKIDGDKATVWASTQTPFNAQQEVARELGLPSANVRVMPVFVGGGFGGKTRNLQIVEAARLAKLAGKPVQMAWTRAEEFFYDSFRPAAVVKIKSGVTDKARIGFWDYRVYFAGERGAKEFYDVPNHSTVAYGAGFGGGPSPHPFATGAWRAPGNNTNTFARESHIDIMAAKAGLDPLAFRLQNLTDPKMRRVLKAAAEQFDWQPARSPSGKGRGIACGIDAGTYVAAIAAAEVDKETGEVKVKHVACAQDMGLAINPEGARIQMEGCITMGLGYALKENIRFKGKEIFDLNFDTYEIPRFSWVPKIETILIDDKEADSQGGGEPAIITMGGAVANAIFDAVGVRLFQLPLTSEAIRNALNKDGHS
ncbi:MAG TPA: molybdopterin cofactor-binding domain-containing protein [Verrucomicrobiae bacterium]|nr:molybdopterin cofactor-binding domain-containing protein [Verrucomicrobiae bacterium]